MTRGLLNKLLNSNSSDRKKWKSITKLKNKCKKQWDKLSSDLDFEDCVFGLTGKDFLGGLNMLKKENNNLFKQYYF